MTERADICSDKDPQISNYTFISAEKIPSLAVLDLWHGLKRHELWWAFAVHEIKQRFRRSTLGPFWLTLSMGIMVLALGYVFSKLFNQKISSFLPYLATGIIFWGLLTAIIHEGCTAFIAGEGFIRNVPMPTSVHFYRVLARNLIIWGHNMVIYLILFFIFFREVSASNLFFVPGFTLFLANVAWMGLVAGILSTRFRDIPQIVFSLLQVVFFITPIFWSVDSLPNRATFIDWNPFYHLIEVVRAPLLGHSPQSISWAVSVGLIVIGLPSTFLLYRKTFARIPHWV